MSQVQLLDNMSCFASVLTFWWLWLFRLQILALAIKVPGLFAKWSSSGGFYGPLQGGLSAADDAESEESWEPRYLWMPATALADTCTAVVLTSAATRTTRQKSRLMLTGVLATWPTSYPNNFNTWANLLVAAVAILGAVCSGRNLYALPWAIAALLFAAMHAENPEAAPETLPMAEMKQL
jgi:hypothetical protein